MSLEQQFTVSQSCASASLKFVRRHKFYNADSFWTTTDSYQRQNTSKSSDNASKGTDELTVIWRKYVAS